MRSAKNKKKKSHQEPAISKLDGPIVEEVELPSVEAERATRSEQPPYNAVSQQDLSADLQAQAPGEHPDQKKNEGPEQPATVVVVPPAPVADPSTNVYRCISSTLDISSKLLGLPVQLASVGLLLFNGARQYGSIGLGAFGFLLEARKQHISRQESREHVDAIRRALAQKNSEREDNGQAPIQPTRRQGYVESSIFGHYGLDSSTISQLLMGLTCLIQLASTGLLIASSATSDKESTFKNAGVILALCQMGFHALDENIKVHNINHEAKRQAQALAVATQPGRR